MTERTIWRTLQLIQWLLAAGSIGIFTFLQLNERSTIIYFPSWCMFMSIFMVAPLFELIKDNEDWRFGVLLIETLSLCLGCMLAGFRTYAILFIALSAKTSTMVSGKKLNTILTVASVGFIFAIEIGLVFHLHRASTPNLSNFVRLLGRIEAELAAFATIWAVGLLGRKMISEQRARKVAESLTKEIQNMTLKLERARIAQDIHDKLGHTLTSLGIQLELTEKHLHKEQVDKAKESLETARQLSADSFNELRRAIHTIRDDFDLSEAMTRLADRIGEQHQNMKVELDVDKAQLPAPSRHELFCIAQECLTNVQKHAKATEVKISLKNVNGHVQLTVEDNGIGVHADQPSNGFGIRGMMDRAKSLGGKLEIGKSATRGTIVRVVVPA
jgi:signal transduction histidine kinase